MGDVYIENRLDSKTRSMLRNRLVNALTRTTQRNSFLKINKHLCLYIPAQPCDGSGRLGDVVAIDLKIARVGTNASSTSRSKDSSACT